MMLMKSKPRSMTAPSEFITVFELAEKTGIFVGKILHLCRSGKLPYYEIDGKIMFIFTEVEYILQPKNECPF